MTDTASEQRNRRVVEAMMAALATGDVDGFGRGLSDTVRWRYMVNNPRLRAISTKAQVLDSWKAGRQATATGLNFTIATIAATGSLVVVEAMSRATFPNGEVFENPFCLVFEFENEKIVEAREYIDSEHVAAQFK